MENNKVLKLGFIIFTNWVPLLNSTENIVAFLAHKRNFEGKLALTLSDYLVNYTKKFEKVSYFFTGVGIVLRDRINQSKIDIAPQRIEMREEAAERLDFAYPFDQYYVTFMIRKPEYKPQIFGIFQTFSLSIWIAIISFLIALTLIYYVTLNWKYSLDKILLHVFAILLRQSLIFKPSSMAEILLVYSWVVGAMCLCLAYDSVFLSFLAIPPVVKINDVAQLALAVENGDYRCVSLPGGNMLDTLLKSNQKNFRTIAIDIKKNNFSHWDALEKFFYGKREQNLAFIGHTQNAEIFETGDVVVSKDKFLNRMHAMGLRKDFCCKKLVETFVHRLMASGLYFKFWNDKIFSTKLVLPSPYEERDPKRKLTLTDVAPAFIFLLTGHFISFLVFIGEMLLSRRKKVKLQLKS